MTRPTKRAWKAPQPHRMIPTPLDGEPVTEGYLCLSTPPPSLNNLFASSGRVRVKSSEYKTWLSLGCLQLRRQHSWHVPGKTRVHLTFNRKQTGADLDNLIKPVLDLLVMCGRIQDDRHVLELSAKFSDTALGTEINVAAAPPLHPSPLMERGEGK